MRHRVNPRTLAELELETARRRTRLERSDFVLAGVDLAPPKPSKAYTEALRCRPVPQRWYTEDPALSISPDQHRVLTGKVQWGPWRYLPRFEVLRHTKSGYEIDLERCVGSAGILDWIAQIAGKTGSGYSAEDLGHLVLAFDDLVELQENVCGCGRDKPRFDVAQHLKAKRKKRVRRP